MTLNLRKLISISTQLSFEACQIIKQSIGDQTCKQYMKGEDDPVTDADFKIQSMLIRGIKMHFPDLKIIGQEVQQFKGDINYNYTNLESDILPSYSTIDQQLETNKACLWIDPIDCTRGFLNGNLQDVTILIGLSYSQKPLAGIIGTPYKSIGISKSYDPVVTIGSVKQKQALDFTGEKWSKKVKQPIHNPLLVTTSNTRTSSSQQNFLRNLKAKSLKAGGSGRKIMMVVNGQADAMAYLDAWTHKWDSCAGDAIIKAMGGYFTTPWGANIIYHPDRATTHNKLGMVASLDREIYEKCMDSMALF